MPHNYPPMAKNFIQPIFLVVILLLSSPSKLLSQVTVPSQTTIYSSPPPPNNFACPYSCQPPPMPTAQCPPPPSPPQVPVPPSFYYPPPPGGGGIPNMPPFWYAPPPPNPILPYFPWYYRYPPPAEFSVAIRLKGEKLITVPCFILPYAKYAEDTLAAFEDKLVSPTPYFPTNNTKQHTPLYFLDCFRLILQILQKPTVSLGTMDGIIDTVSAMHPILPLINLLKSHGKLILVGAPQKPHELPVFPLITGRKMVGGSGIGGMKETQEMIDFAAKHNITSDIEMIPIEYVNTGVERLLKADVRY